MSRSPLPLLALALPLAWTAPAAAHPHAWIDLESRLIFDDAGRLTALELDWLFDEFYTAFIAEEFTASGKPASAYLEEVAAENLANLRAYDYFTTVELDGERLPLGDVTRFETNIVGERLRLAFTVPLVESVEPAGSLLSVAVYDPTYYIEVLYKEGVSPVLDGLEGDACSLFVMPPTPTPEQVAMAFMLDASQTGEDGLGRHFAEIAQLDCR